MSQSSELPHAIFLMGPTATGKTQLAVEIVSRLPCEIISVDSALVYKYMDIGTAKPTADILKEAPHRLIDFLDPKESYSAARFREDALLEMQEITSRGKVPLLVGGTGLYFRALEYGLSDMPAANSSVRLRIEALAAEYGWAYMHEQLRAVDPESAMRIHPNDPQRVQRALEVYELTGRSLSDHFSSETFMKIPYIIKKISLLVKDRELLHNRIAERFGRMMELGLLQEVRALYDRGDLNLNMPSMRCVGYRQVWQHFDGEFDLDAMREKAIIATRQLAKRQMTWLRNVSDSHHVDAGNSDISLLIRRLSAYF